MLADPVACDSGASPSWTRGQRLLDGEVKIPGSRKGGTVRVRYVPLSIAIEGEFGHPGG